MSNVQYPANFTILLQSLKLNIRFLKKIGYLDIRNFCYDARKRPLASKRHGEIFCFFSSELD